MSWSRAQRFISVWFIFSSAAMIPAMCADSMRCLSTFCPYEVR